MFHYKILSVAWLVMTISLILGYSPGKFEVFCSYAVATCAFSAKGFKGDEN